MNVTKSIDSYHADEKVLLTAVGAAYIAAKAAAKIAFRDSYNLGNSTAVAEAASDEAFLNVFKARRAEINGQSSTSTYHVY